MLPTYVDSILASYYGNPGLSVAEVKTLKDFPKIKKDVEIFYNNYKNLYNSSHQFYPNQVYNIQERKSDFIQYRMFNSDGQYFTDTTQTDWTDDINLQEKYFSGSSEFPYIMKLFGSLPSLGAAWLNVMHPTPRVFYHRENLFTQYKNKSTFRIRFLIPIINNNNSYIQVNREVYKLEEGKIYFLNQGAVHAPLNKGNTLRINFVCDCLFTPELIKWMADLTNLRSVETVENHPIPESDVRDDRYHNITLKDISVVSYK